MTPSFEGPKGRAWVLPPVPTSPMLLGAILAEVPAAHPFWSWYLFAVVDLRPRDGIPPAVLKYPEAEFELTVHALDPGPPDTPRRVYDPAAGCPPTSSFLSPTNVVEQFHGVGTEGAPWVLGRLVRGVVRGVLSPDSDWRRVWTSAVARQVDHLGRARPRTTIGEA